MQDSILFVDDSQITLEILQDLFHDADFRLFTAYDALTALDIVKREEITVVVSDNVMPGMSGLDFLSSLKDISPDTVKILMSAYADLASALAAINRSEVYRFILKPWEDKDMVAAVEQGRERFRMMQKIRMEDEAVLRSLAQAIELKDPSTRGHCDRVAVYAVSLAESLGLSRDYRREIKYGSWLHDCGKIGVPEAILNGPGQLSSAEFETMKRHSSWGNDVAVKANLSLVARNVIRYHHERYDGRGYPDGLSGENIPLEARIVAVADVFDALSSDRPYRPSFPLQETIGMVESMRGNVLDPELTNKLLDLVREGEVTGGMLTNP
jgi:response regulator RpfG family c-di-GMP phosphodiesterase